MLTTLTFDLDNTLLDRDGAHHAALIRFTEQHPGVFPPARREQDLAELMIHDHHGWTPRQAYGQWVKQCYPGLELSADEIWTGLADSLVQYVQPVPGVAELLMDLGARYQLAIITNGSTHRQRAKARQAGIDASLPWFDSQAVGAAKPSPALFERALAQLGCPPARALHIGDDPRRDVGGAAAAGLCTCWVHLGEMLPSTGPLPDCCIDHVNDLGGLL